MSRRNRELEEVKLFVASLLNEEQDLHSKLLADLKSRVGNTKQCQDLIEVLTKIFEGKTKVLEKVYKKIQEVE